MQLAKVASIGKEEAKEEEQHSIGGGKNKSLSLRERALLSFQTKQPQHSVDAAATACAVAENQAPLKSRSLMERMAKFAENQDSAKSEDVARQAQRARLE